MVSVQSGMSVSRVWRVVHVMTAGGSELDGGVAAALTDASRFAGSSDGISKGA